MHHNHVRSTAWLSVTSPPLWRWSATCFHVLLLPFTCTLDLLQLMSFTVIDTACKRQTGARVDGLSVANGLAGQATGVLYDSTQTSKGGHWMLYSSCCYPVSAALRFLSGARCLMHHSWQVTALVSTTHQENEV